MLVNKPDRQIIDYKPTFNYILKVQLYHHEAFFGLRNFDVDPFVNLSKW